MPAVETVKAESFPMECFEKGYIFYQKMVYKSGHLDGGSRFKIFHGSPLPFPSCMLLNCSRYIVWKPRSTREIGNDNFLKKYVWVLEVVNTADTPNPPWLLPLKGNLVPPGQRKFDSLPSLPRPVPVLAS